MSLGVISDVNTPSYVELRNRENAGWYSEEMKRFLSGKLSDSNKTYGKFRKFISNVVGVADNCAYKAYRTVRNIKRRPAMKIAYLLLCHKNPEQINRLIKMLDAPDCYFVVHVDKKSDGLNISRKDNVVFVEDAFRVDVRWATISMIEATFELLKRAFQLGVHFDYYCLISGQDFPVKNNEFIHKYLEENNGANFIEVLEHTNPLFIRYSKRNAIYYPNWMFSRKTSVKVLKKIYIYLTGGYSRTSSLWRRKYLDDVQFEYGAQWWCLTNEVVQWIFEYYQKNGLQLFLNSMTPDECVFQTLFMMSPFRESRKNKITFFEWDKNGNNPRLIVEEDIPILLNMKDCLFARKFDMQVDSKSLNLLENSLK